jgi:dihydrofolate reductase
MGRLVYAGIGSLDGYIADVNGAFDWSMPDEEVHAHINERDRNVVAELYGRRLYEVMKVWETYGTGQDATKVERQYGEIWRNRDKIVYSTTLESVETGRTRLEKHFDPDAVRRFVDGADGDVNIGGPELAAHALRAGIVDVVEYYANPLILGGGKHWLPQGVRLPLRLVAERRFGNGVVFLTYEVSVQQS